MKPNGIELGIHLGKGGLWPDTEASTGPSKWSLGLKVALRWGPWWLSLPTNWPALRSCCWDKIDQPGCTWKILTGKFLVMPFVTIVIGTWGFYLGAKYNGWNQDFCLIPSVRICHGRLD